MEEAVKQAAMWALIVLGYLVLEGLWGRRS